MWPFVENVPGTAIVENVPGTGIQAKLVKKRGPKPKAK